MTMEEQAALLKDKERLDWMDQNDSLDVIDFFINEAEPIRAAIDKAMRHGIYRKAGDILNPICFPQDEENQ